MLDLSPTKLLIIFVVAVLLLGPKKLPQVARQLGAGWRRLRELHRQIEGEVRQTIPDLPSSQDIVRFARSPVALLNQLADRPLAPRGAAAEDPAAPKADASAAATALDDGRSASHDAAVSGTGAAAADETPTWGAGLTVMGRDDPTLN